MQQQLLDALSQNCQAKFQSECIQSKSEVE